MSERLQIALPKGELQNDVISFIQEIGINIAPTQRGLLIESNDFPVDFVLIRASDVPRFVKDEEATISIGITGSDIIWEAGMGKDRNEEIPIYQFNPQAKQSKLYVGVTQRLKAILGKDDLTYRDIADTQVATKFPRIANDYFTEKDISPKLILVPGADEAMQYIMPNCNAVLGIISTVDTIQANNIDVLETFYDVTLRFVQEESKMSNTDLLIFNEFKEKIAVALERKRML